jgi:hypothetical protein
MGDVLSALHHDKEIPDFPGINTPYAFFGGRHTLFGVHREDVSSEMGYLFCPVKLTDSLTFFRSADSSLEHRRSGMPSLVIKQTCLKRS